MKKLVITDWNTLSMTDDLSTAALQELADVTAYPLTAPEAVTATYEGGRSCCSHWRCRTVALQQNPHHRSRAGCLPKLGIYRRNGNRIQQY